MLIKRSPNGIDLPFSSEITPRDVYESRRSFMKQIAMGAVGSAALLEMANREAFAQGGGNPKLAATHNPAYSALDKQTPYKDATTYNNFYEFGTDKSEPAMNASTLKTRPWTVPSRAKSRSR
jgi:sulfoxide reductase catalytic subunit YedY